MNGFAARAAMVAAVGVLAAAAAMGGAPDPEPAAAPEPAPAPVPAPEDDSLEIIRLKISVIEVRLDAAQAMGSAHSQKIRDEITIVLQYLDALHSRLEDRLQNR